MNRPPIPGTPSPRPLPMVPLPVPDPPDRAPVTVPGHQHPGRPRWVPSRRVLVAGAASAAVGGAVVAFAAGGAPARHPVPPVHPPPLRACLTTGAVPCYGPDPLHRASVVAATGDSGPTASFGPGHIHRQRTVVWPASDPLVTAVGATVPHIGAAGRRLAPDTVDGVTAPPGGYATGAGTSALFPRPAYQNPVAAVVGDHRGVADVAMDGCAWVYLHIPRLAHGLTWYFTCGTSFSAPLFAGITADAAQIAGHPLGPLNPALYQMHGPADGVLDVTHGNDSLPGVPGYSAGPGFDLPSGIGAVGNAAWFATTLGRLAHRPHR